MDLICSQEMVWFHSEPHPRLFMESLLVLKARNTLPCWGHQVSVKCLNNCCTVHKDIIHCECADLKDWDAFSVQLSCHHAKNPFQVWLTI